MTADGFLTIAVLALAAVGFTTILLKVVEILDKWFVLRRRDK
jgi:hypothetical protein